MRVWGKARTLPVLPSSSWFVHARVREGNTEEIGVVNLEFVHARVGEGTEQANDHLHAIAHMRGKPTTRIRITCSMERLRVVTACSS